MRRLSDAIGHDVHIIDVMTAYAPSHSRVECQVSIMISKEKEQMIADLFGIKSCDIPIVLNGKFHIQGFIE